VFAAHSFYSPAVFAAHSFYSPAVLPRSIFYFFRAIWYRGLFAASHMLPRNSLDICRAVLMPRPIFYFPAVCSRVQFYFPAVFSA
ncbi:MAG: hypothetical protein ACK559_01295, partial [bacterium]